MSINQLIGTILMGIGAFFYFLGGLGVFRMPDVFNRLQAGTKASTLGAMTFVIGVGIFQPQFLIKTIVIAIFIAFTNPVGSSVLARSALITNAYGAKDKGYDNIDEECKLR